ncbi:tetratricopeptide repeat protein [Candidatus Pelagibacter sp. Uisw_101]|uniref:O-linked N-acetylglucosamine transferase, SPINDLY family protein n=1 Tax=Candidatus Pelagibacter sp. Uisw_101 TaxID=3230982 RepID=UPI0039ED6679
MITDQTLQRAITAHQEGRLEEADHLYQKILETQPTHPDANHNLGVLKVLLNKSADALLLFKIAVESNPSIEQYWYSYSNTLIREKKFKEAEAISRKAIKFKPNFVTIHFNLGFILNEIGKFKEAELSYKKAITLKPEFVEAYYNLGATLQALGRTDEAVESYKKAIMLKPKFVEAHNNLGVILKDLGKFDDAEASYKKAIEYKVDYAEALSNLGEVQKSLGRIDDSLSNYKYAYQLKPDLDYLLGALIHLKMNFCIWDDLPKNINMLTKKINNGEKASTPFALLSLIDDPSIHKKAAEIYSNDKFPRSNIFPRIPQYHDHEKIKIGYFSADFWNHPTSYLTAELYENHDRKKFEIHAFSFGLDTNDKFNIRIKEGVDYFHDVRTMSDYDVVKLVRSLEIDIAIDLKGFTGMNRQGIFAMSTAPIQVSYLGYPGTMAVDYLDYLIADRTLILKEKEKDYSEKIVYMPNSYQPNVSKKSAFKSSLTRQDVGLPNRGFVFCCFNNQYKITPLTFAGWMRILKATDGSVLWLLVNNINAAKNLKKEAVKLGINEDRLIFANYIPNEEHLKRIQLADLFIDTLPYNAHTTASDALRMGLPVLTCIGDSFAGRVAASLLNAVRLPELITTSQDQYESLAIALAKNPEKMKIIKDKLVNNLNKTTLYDAALYTRNLEVAYSVMYKRFKNKIDLNDIKINS